MSGFTVDEEFIGPYGMVGGVPPDPEMFPGRIMFCHEGSSFSLLSEECFMKGLTPFQIYVYEELKAIGGEPNYTSDMNFWGINAKVWKWSTMHGGMTDKKVQILILRDKALELGLKAVAMNDDWDRVKPRQAKRKITLDVGNELVNSVSVWVPSEGAVPL